MRVDELHGARHFRFDRNRLPDPGLGKGSVVGYHARMLYWRNAFIVIAASLLGVDARLVHAGGA